MWTRSDKRTAVFIPESVICPILIVSLKISSKYLFIIISQRLSITKNMYFQNIIYHWTCEVTEKRWQNRPNRPHRHTTNPLHTIFTHYTHTHRMTNEPDNVKLVRSNLCIYNINNIRVLTQAHFNFQTWIAY